ncbi:MAG: glucose-6-phosphate dehydrogenase [Deltaproteobacteria bacterium]|nr:glucose-6-phosphate dehydrogenase [Deltaproteobacteria bacterium]
MDVAANPLREGLAQDRIPDECTVVIFGASGDLTKRKLLPALYSLARDRMLTRVAIVGFARRPVADDAFREQMLEGVNEHARRRPVHADLWKSFASRVHYHQGSFDNVEDYRTLKARLEQIERESGMPPNRIFYLSTPPSSFGPIVRALGAAGLVPRDGQGYARVIVEKPFGVDYRSAERLNAELHAVLDEEQIYRIDHYLGKETVQNMLVFRFANAIFEPLMNGKYVDHVQITGAEAIGVEGRGGYFEEAGILRDMVQNHLLQVLCMAAMEPPVGFDAASVRDEKTKVLRALRPLSAEDVRRHVVRGQYGAGSVLARQVPGYREEPGVNPASSTETYVALEMAIDNWRWAGVPFFLRSAKRMPKRVTEVAIHFKQAPLALFGAAHVVPNVLALRIQPDEGISLNMGSKVPGPSVAVTPVTMEFRYASSFGAEPPEAYERLLLDCMLGDTTLFTRADWVLESWRYVSRIHETWAADRRPDMPPYEAGTWGPAEADALLARTGRTWRRP